MKHIGGLWPAPSGARMAKRAWGKGVLVSGKSLLAGILLLVSDPASVVGTASTEETTWSRVKGPYR